MSTLMAPTVTLRRDDNSQAVASLIANARRKLVPLAPQPRAWPAVGAMLAFAAVHWASFAPLDWSPLGWLSTVPLWWLVRSPNAARRLYWSAYLGGLAFFAPALQWMRLGDPSMYVAWLALSVYLAAYVPLALAIVRGAVHRLHVPLVLAAPAVWVAGELVRGHLLTGMSWYLLGHTQYRWLELIQISDITGAYGVSFVLATAAAALAAATPEKWLMSCGVLLTPTSDFTQPAWRSTRAVSWPLGWSLVFVVSVLTYGYVRRQQADFTPGPRVALIQGNFPASIRVNEEDFGAQFLAHIKLTGMAVQQQPDLVVWPEGMYRWALLDVPPHVTDEDLERITPEFPPSTWRDQVIRRSLQTESQKAGAAMIIGLEATVAGKDRYRRYNSAAFVRPDVGVAGRYDKVHLVPFGEYLPLRDWLPFLSAFTPYRADMGLQAGTQAAMFEYRNWRLMPQICFEDTVPHLTRSMVALGSQAERGTQVDVLVTLTNDGWFHGSSGLDQHLVSAAFRAVETRTPVIRAANTGVSAVIDGDGAIVTPERWIDGATREPQPWRNPTTGRWRKQEEGALIHTTPLDSRTSVYVARGDWFAGLCLLCTVGMALAAMIRWRPGIVVSPKLDMTLASP